VIAAAQQRRIPRLVHLSRRQSIFELAATIRDIRETSPALRFYSKSLRWPQNIGGKSRNGICRSGRVASRFWKYLGACGTSRVNGGGATPLVFPGVRSVPAPER